MKSMIWGLSRMAVFTGLVILGSGTPAFAAEGREAPAERSERLEQRLNQMGQHQEQLMRQVGGQMERLEQRLNQMAERQEQLMRQVGGQMERMGATAQAGRENMRRPMPLQEGVRRPMLPEGVAPAGRQLKAVGDVLGLLCLIWIVCNILLAIWIFIDIRKRGEGPAIFVAMALVAGIPAALIYSLIRIGDKKTSSP
jgi:hypothetical protein